MKKLLLALFAWISILNVTQAQSSPNTNDTEKTRTVYYFIADLDNAAEVQTLTDYLNQFDGKIVTVSTNLTTQMCTIEVMNIRNEDIEQIIAQAGFMGLERPELPPAGQKFVYNPDGTWKIKDL